MEKRKIRVYDGRDEREIGNILTDLESNEMAIFLKPLESDNMDKVLHNNNSETIEVKLKRKNDIEELNLEIRKTFK